MEEMRQKQKLNNGKEKREALNFISFHFIDANCFTAPDYPLTTRRRLHRADVKFVKRKVQKSKQKEKRN
jgi:hypothetical protein